MADPAHTTTAGSKAFAVEVSRGRRPVLWRTYADRAEAARMAAKLRAIGMQAVWRDLRDERDGAAEVPT
jgi:hypothetical protein